MAARLEHANLTVPDVDAAIDFLITVEPTLRVLHDSGNAGAYRWVHLSAGKTYIAIEEPQKPVTEVHPHRRYQDYGINHLGLIIDDIEAAATRLSAKGFRKGPLSENHPARIRRYFYDTAGFEWELVQYLTDEPAKRFTYS